MSGPSLENPFLALRSFRREDARRFFGRDSDLVLIQSRLYTARSLLLFAGSGVGKTSFLNARLTPAIEDQWVIVNHRSWAAQTPLEGLTRAIAETVPAEGAADLSAIGHLERIIARDEHPRGCLIMLDQFEEVFQRWRESKALDLFAAEIGKLVHMQRLDVRVLFSMREEFLGELSLFDNLIPDLFNNSYRLKNPTRAEAEEIIVRTALSEHGTTCGAGLEPLLDDLLIAPRLGAEPARAEPSSQCRVPMPFLQIVCHRIWQREMMRGASDTAAPRRFLQSRPGPVRAELDGYCRQTLDALTPAERALASAAFGLLMTPAGAKMAYPVDVLAKQAHVEEAPLRSVLEKLATPDVRILRPIPAGPNSSPWFELYHDLYTRFLSDWKREQDDAVALQRRRRTTRVIAGAVALAAAAVIALGFISQRASAQKQTDFAQQLLHTATDLRAPDSPQTPLSLLLTREAFLRNPDDASRAALRAAVAAPLIERAVVNEGDMKVRAVSPAGDVLVAGPDNDLILKRVPSLEVIGQVHRNAIVSSVAFSPDGSVVAAAGWDGNVELISASSGQKTGTLEITNRGTPTAVMYSRRGKLLATAVTEEGRHVVQVREPRPDGMILPLIKHASRTTAMAFSPDERLLLIGRQDGTVQLIDVQTGVPRVSFTYATPGGGEQYERATAVVAAAFSIEGATFVTATQTGSALITTVEDGHSDPLPGLQDKSVNILVFSPLGSFLATGQGLLWDLLVWMPWTFWHGPAVNLLSFTPDERLLAAGGSTSKDVVVVETVTYKVIARWQPEANVSFMSFSQTGDQLVVRSAGQARFFRIRPAGEPVPENDAALEALACQLAARSLTEEETKKYLKEEAPRICTGR